MKVQAAVLTMSMAFGMVSGACTRLLEQPIGHRRDFQQRVSGRGWNLRRRNRGRVVLPQRDGLRRQRGRNLERDVVVPGTERGPDVSLVGLDPRSCKTVTISGSLNVSGTWTANADGTYTDGTTTMGERDRPARGRVLDALGHHRDVRGDSGPLAAVGFSSVSCANAATGGGCTCTGTVNTWARSAGDPAIRRRTATTPPSGNTLTLDDARRTTPTASRAKS